MSFSGFQSMLNSFNENRAQNPSMWSGIGPANPSYADAHRRDLDSPRDPPSMPTRSRSDRASSIQSMDMEHSPERSEPGNDSEEDDSPVRPGNRRASKRLPSQTTGHKSGPEPARPPKRRIPKRIRDLYGSIDTERIGKAKSKKIRMFRLPSLI